jgi:hypothetical protein
MLVNNGSAEDVNSIEEPFMALDTEGICTLVKLHISKVPMTANSPPSRSLIYMIFK